MRSHWTSPWTASRPARASLLDRPLRTLEFILAVFESEDAFASGVIHGMELARSEATAEDTYLDLRSESRAGLALRA